MGDGNDLRNVLGYVRAHIAPFLRRAFVCIVHDAVLVWLCESSHSLFTSRAMRYTTFFRCIRRVSTTRCEGSYENHTSHCLIGSRNTQDGVSLSGTISSPACYNWTGTHLTELFRVPKRYRTHLCERGVVSQRFPTRSPHDHAVTHRDVHEQRPGSVEGRRSSLPGT